MRRAQGVYARLGRSMRAHDVACVCPGRNIRAQDVTGVWVQDVACEGCVGQPLSFRHFLLSVLTRSLS